MQQRTPRVDSLKSIGLKRFMDERYYRYGGYVKLDQMLQEVQAGKSSLAEVARAFSAPDRPMSRQNPRNWYELWLEEKNQ